MAIKRPKPEEIVVKLRQVEVLMGQPSCAATRYGPQSIQSRPHCPDGEQRRGLKGLRQRMSEVKYNPHSVKDTLAVERDRRPLTERQRRAWSLNMGHASEKITQTHYGTIGDDERTALFEVISEAKVVATRALSDEEMIALVDAVQAALEVK